MTKEKTPPTPEKSPNLEFILEPIWTSEKVKSEVRELFNRVEKFEKEWYG